jgi:hypothetical protein
MLRNKFLANLFLIISLVFPTNLLSMDCFQDDECPWWKIDFEKEIEPLTLDLVKQITLENWKDRPMISGDFLYLVDAFASMMISTYRSCNWAEGENVEEQVSKILALKTTGAVQFPAAPLLPCVAKLILPAKSKMNIIGDIHGNLDTTEDLLDSLFKNGIIDKFMKTLHGEYLFFLGDYFDRGEDSFKVFSTALLLAIKNPGKVFLLRGNHEFIKINQKFNLEGALAKFKVDEIRKILLVNFLVMVYEFLLAEVLVGYSGPQIKYQFLVHSCPDFRFDYSTILNFHEEEHAQKAQAIYFWHLKRDGCLNSTQLQAFFDGIKKRYDQFELMHNLLPKYFLGFLGCDIEIQDSCVLEGKKEFEHGSAVSCYFIREFFDLFTTSSHQIVGVIHGHQHLSPAKMVRRDPIGLMPGCCGFCTSRKNQQCDLFMPGRNTYFCSADTFPIFTVISGAIISKRNGFLDYQSTFLRTWCGEVAESGVWAAQAVY